MSEENKLVVRAWFDNFNSGNFEAQRELAHKDHRFHFPLSEETWDGETHVNAEIGFKAAVPDLHVELLEQISAEGDKVVTRFVTRGTHTGDFQGKPATGNKIEFSGINIMRVADGKNIEEWSIFDTHALETALTAVASADSVEK